MGGTGSGRWGTTVTRITTDSLPQLDVRALAREGALEPGTSATITWGNGASVSTEAPLESPGWITLRYMACAGMGSWTSLSEHVPLSKTDCTFGGSRVWFYCPGCGRRRAILYGLQSRFRCRACHRLGYESTRSENKPGPWY